MSDEIYRWYYHAKGRNETKAAIAAALDNGAPLLLMVCKPSCAVCAKVWQALDATGRFADFLRAERVVALKIEDTASHFTDLAKAKNKYTGIDGVSGKKVNSTAPFFILFTPAEAARNKSKITLAPEQVAQYLSGFGSAKASAKTYEALTSWIGEHTWPVACR